MVAPTVTNVQVPLRVDETDTIRVGKTRVTLDLVIDAFKSGETPAQIVKMYDVLSLGDVYAVIAYYLQHQAELDSYFHQHRAEAENVRRENEARFDNSEVHARLLARLEQKKRGQADSP